MIFYSYILFDAALRDLISNLVWFFVKIKLCYLKGSNFGDVSQCHKGLQ